MRLRVLQSPLMMQLLALVKWTVSPAQSASWPQKLAPCCLAVFKDARDNRSGSLSRVANLGGNRPIAYQGVSKKLSLLEF